MSKNNCILFEKKLAHHTAPTLLGIKCASLFSISNPMPEIELHIDFFNKKSAVKGLEIKLLCRCSHYVLIMVYHSSLMKKRFNDLEVRNLLKKFGYSEDMSLEQCINKLSSKISNENSFPHEIGIFLGYPLEDVIGFIDNRGENCKMCGCWKVYGDVEKAERTFQNYDKCRKFLCNKLNKGVDIYQALKIS